MPVKLQQRFNIFFSQRMGVTMSVTVKAIQYVYGDSALSKVQIRHWWRLFAAGRNVVVDLPCRSKERTGRTDGNIQRIKGLLDADKRLTIANLSVQTGISWSTCHRIVHLDLQLTRKSTKFVPHLLQECHLRDRFDMSSRMLAKIKEDPHFLETVITMDESWVYCYNPELKCQSSAWLAKGEPRPMKVAHPRAVGKVLLVSFFDAKGMVHHEYLRRMVNTEIFVDILSRLRHAISRKHGHKYLKEFTLHMDNASPHTSEDTRKFLMLSRTKVMEHPAYSPDLAPSDYWLYPRLKRPLRGHKFNSLQELEAAVNTQIGEIASFEFEHCIKTQWPSRWVRCVNADGMYFEGLH